MLPFFNAFQTFALEDSLWVGLKFPLVPYLPHKTHSLSDVFIPILRWCYLSDKLGSCPPERNRGRSPQCCWALLASSLFPAFLLGWEGREVSVHELLKLLANCSRIWQKGWGCGQIRKQGHADRGERSDLQQHFGSADALLQQLSVKPRERSSCCWRPPEGDPARLNPSA